MATLEIASSRVPINQHPYHHQQQQHKNRTALTRSMQRTRGMGRPQQREPPSTDFVSGPQDTHAVAPASPASGTVSTQHHQQHHPPRPTRNNSKLKVLVRSHAMREETSPPREPTSTNIHAPCIKLNTPPSVSPIPAGAVSPVHHLEQGTVLSCNHNILPSSSPVMPSSPTQNPCLIVSPTEDVVLNSPPLTPRSSMSVSPVEATYVRSEASATVRTQEALHSALTRKLNGGGGEYSAKYDEKGAENSAVNRSFSGENDNVTNSNNSSPMQTSSAASHQKNSVSKDSQRIAVDCINSNNTRASCNKSDQPANLLSNCDCYMQSCAKCFKNNERNLNNNTNNINNNNVVSVVTSHSLSSNTLTVSRVNPRHKLRHQSSSQGSFEGSSSTSPCLSRDSSTELYTDTTGIDLTQFIIETLNKNAKDRVLMLKIEQELVNLAKDKNKTHFKFPPMSSYQRMLVHRCAAYFGMDHNIEISGKSVVVNKTKTTRLPEMRFRDHIREDLLFPEEPRRSILKRDSNSFEDCNYKSPDRQFDNRRSKSFEEREEEYEKARRRIFKDGYMHDCNSQEDFNWDEMPWSEHECTKIRLHPSEMQISKPNRLAKGQSVDGRSESLRPCMAKSYSFGGYGGSVSVLTRGDSVSSTHSAGPRLLTKQDSSTSTISWRLSPSSSGYKSQSQRSDSVTPSPTATPHQLSDASGKSCLEGFDPIHHSITEETVEQTQQTEKHIENSPSADGNQLVWAVTDMQSVPKGSVLIDPQTGQPLTNRDGSIYHFDPSNPPPGFNNSSKPPPSPPKATTPQKSPVKERAPSPKKPPKPARASPLKNKSFFINSSTSPSLPMTPPTPTQNQTTVMSYTTTANPMDNTANMATMQSYPVYPNGYVQAQVPSADGSVPVYQPSLGMVYTTPYAMPPPYENRPDPMSELSGYFVNMAVSDPSCANQSVGYQTPSTGYWPQQPITYYQQPTTPSQQPPQPRYPVQIPIAGQTQAPYYPQNYVPVTPNPAPAPVASNADLVPVYATNPPMQMVYPAQPNPPNPMYIQSSPNPVVYSQGTVYPPTQPPIYSNNITAPYTPSNQCYGPSTQGSYMPQNIHTIPPSGYDHRATQQRSTPKSNKQPGHMQKIGHGFIPQNVHSQQQQQQQQQHQQQHQQSQQQHGSNQSSGGSNSPANTVIAGYFPASSNTPVGYRQCTPPETPPTQNLGYGYPPNYMSHSVIFRSLGSVRASPPVNIRSSRSPTPGPDYPQILSMDRNQRYSIPPALYHGDVRLMSNRTQAPVYRQPYRQQNAAQSVQDNGSSGRAHKPRKPRAKVPALPPSGRQSNQSIQASQHRF